MITKEQFNKMNFDSTYEEYQACDCGECERECQHRGAYRRRPEADGGLGLCERLKEYHDKGEWER